MALNASIGTLCGNVVLLYMLVDTDVSAPEKAKLMIPGKPEQIEGMKLEAFYRFYQEIFWT